MKRFNPLLLLVACFSLNSCRDYSVEVAELKIRNAALETRLKVIEDKIDLC